MCGALNNYYEGAEYNDNCYYNKVLVNINIEVLINCWWIIMMMIGIIIKCWWIIMIVYLIIIVDILNC